MSAAAYELEPQHLLTRSLYCMQFSLSGSLGDGKISWQTIIAVVAAACSFVVALVNGIAAYYRLVSAMCHGCMQVYRHVLEARQAHSCTSQLTWHLHATDWHAGTVKHSKSCSRRSAGSSSSRCARVCCMGHSCTHKLPWLYSTRPLSGHSSLKRTYRAQDSTAEAVRKMRFTSFQSTAAHQHALSLICCRTANIATYHAVIHVPNIYNCNMAVTPPAERPGGSAAPARPF